MNSHDLAIYKSIIKSQTETHFDIGMVIYTMYSSTLTCQNVHPSRRVWFERVCQDTPWKETAEATIKNKLSTEVSRMYVQTARILFNRAISEDGELLKPHYITIANKLVNISIRLKDVVTFKNAILRQMADLFQFTK
jgi:hypothetical protein